MAEVGVYYVTIMPDMAQFSNKIVTEINGTAQATNAAGSRAGGSFASGFGQAAAVFLGNVMTQISQQMVAGIQGGIERLDTMAVFPKIMANMGIAADDSQLAISRVSEAIVGLPTALDDAARSVQRLTMSTGDIDRATDVFIAFNNALISGGAPIQLQASALEQFTQAVTKGKPDMLEWRTLMNAMPAQLAQIAASMGMTTAELGEGLRKADIPMSDFLDAIVRLNDEGVNGFGSFSEQVKSMTGTVQVALANTRNRIEKFWQEIFESVGQERIAGAINGITSQLPAWGQEVGSFLQDLKWDIEGVMGWFGDLNEATGMLDSLRDSWDKLTEHIDGQEIRGTIRILGEGLAKGTSLWVLFFEALASGAMGGAGYTIDFFDYLFNRSKDDWKNPVTGGSWYESQEWYGGSTQLEDGRTMVTVLSTEQINANREAMELWAASTDESWKFVQERFESIDSKAADAYNSMLAMADVYQQEAARTDESWKFVQERFESASSTFGDTASQIVDNNEWMTATLDESWKFMQENQAEATSQMKNAAITAMDEAMAKASGVGTEFNAVLDSIESNGTGVADKLRDSFTSAGSSIGDTLKGIQAQVDGLHGKTIDISVVKSGISKIGMDGTLAGGGISIWTAANGGIATRASIGIFGEAGDEALIPLSNREKVRPFAQAVAAEMGGGTVNNYYIDGNLVAADAALAAALDTVAQRVGGRRRMGVVNG